MTSNEIAQRDSGADLAPAASQPEPTVGTAALMAWAQEADLAYQMATKLASTSFVPQSLRGKPGDIAAAILAGSELGLKPMATLKSIDVIQGTPALRAHAMRGVVQKQGHDIELVESTAIYCKMHGRRKGKKTWQTVEWDIPRAQALGLTGKPEWKKQPKTMLVARATGELCRLIASDALHGMPYVAEELEGTVHAEIVPEKAPLDITALTAQAQPGQASDETYTVSRDDQPGADQWAEEADDTVDWPEAAQPGGAA